MRLQEKIGEAHGRLTVLFRSQDVSTTDRVCWVCECSCGEWSIVSTGKLNNNHSSSCGCYHREITSTKNTGNNHSMKYKQMDRDDWKTYSTYISASKGRYDVTEEGIRNLQDDQRGCCLICKESLDHLGKCFHIDHDHNTGEVRGLLCTHCNLGIGFFKDSVDLMKNAAAYLQRRDNL